MVVSLAVVVGGESATLGEVGCFIDRSRYQKSLKTW
jgi:hypothetical protein